jgi:hypothetical protein
MLAGYSFQDFHHLETVQLGGNAASVTFSNLLQYSGEFTHLQIRYTARTTQNSFVDDGILMTFNGDSVTSNYKSHGLSGGGTSGFISGVVSSADWYGTQAIGMAAGTLSSSGGFGAGVIEILEPFIGTKNKTSRCFSGMFHSASAVNSYSAARVLLSSHLRVNTEQVTSSSLFPAGGRSFVAGSRFSLYGVK